MTVKFNVVWGAVRAPAWAVIVWALTLEHTSQIIRLLAPAGYMPGSVIGNRVTLESLPT